MAKRIRVTQVIVPPEHTRDHVIKKACRISGIRPEDVRNTEIVRQSLDARKKGDIKYTYTIDLIIPSNVSCHEKDPRVSKVTPIQYDPQATGQEEMTVPIAVIGSGPAGLFCAYLLALYGYRPVVFERGKRVEERLADVEKFWKDGRLDPDSNVQFGEGGAGTFSDGKLNTTVKDRMGRNRFVLETFVRFGAPKDILYVSRPHIGTDILCSIISNMREEIIRYGGSFMFSAAVSDIEIKDNRVAALVTETGEKMETSAAVFAIGHSARDTFAMLRDRGVSMVPKPFAVGFRVEHPQAEINTSQYGEDADLSLFPPASYKLTYRASNGRSVYSFCMCPGGYVVNASSEEEYTAVNGMSYFARDGKNANSAILVSVTPEDFPDPSDPLSGVAFQRELEKKAFSAGKGKIPQQRFGAFQQDPSISGPDPDQSKEGAPFASCTKGGAVFTDIRDVLPDAVREAFVEGMHAFSKKIRDFDRDDVILSAVESRSSSPVCIKRNELYESNISGLYPCGEGAGYAGGITSAAIDGLKTAESLMSRFAPCADDSEERIKRSDIHES
ncbi:MAG: NAD(P)-binding protein [Lachnospiraceae bacterium]|nr:NAD(P)-binding protein [Lachnospiraceae bacterium]